MTKVKLVAVTEPKIDGLETAEDLIAYCARVSNKKNQHNTATAPKLLKYLIDNKHWSPLEMATMVLEVETTRDISRQILRHRSFFFQEHSQRYSSDTGFTERECRLQDTKNRQNSIQNNNRLLSAAFILSGKGVAWLCGSLYRLFLRCGVAKEQARAILPEGLTVTRLYMAGNVRSWVHYCQLRCGNGTQKEHMEVAEQCKEILLREFPALDGCFDEVE